MKAEFGSSARSPRRSHLLGMSGVNAAISVSDNPAMHTPGLMDIHIQHAQQSFHRLRMTACMSKAKHSKKGMSPHKGSLWQADLCWPA